MSPMSATQHHHSASIDLDADAALLDILTGPIPPKPKSAFVRRDAALDPLLIAAAAASGPHVTRNHYHHDFFPGVMLPQSEDSWDWTTWKGDTTKPPERKRYTYVSKQGPRRQRLQGLEPEEGKENDAPQEIEPLKTVDNIPHSSRKRRSSLISTSFPNPEERSQLKPISTPIVESTATTITRAPVDVDVKCMARTRIPTPHGPVFLHLYHNNRDGKEHLAIVVDPAQFADKSPSMSAPPIRSRSLDAVWADDETEMDRIIRGAYVGRLSPTSQHAFNPSSHPPKTMNGVPPPLIRLHSECFTGETVGSMRCDCGEQLDEAIRLISQPITIPSSSPLFEPTVIPGRGAVVYLRQEGRGIGLLSKIRAYNLQDIGHDTVTANLMLGHKADERGYEVAGAILRDLGLGSDSDSRMGEGVRLLTNNPDKVEALQREGLKVVDHVSMIPRSWQARQPQVSTKKLDIESHPSLSVKDETERVPGATLIGGNAVHGEDLDKYLRTKVLKMGHMLPLWMEHVEVASY